MASAKGYCAEILGDSFEADTAMIQGYISTLQAVQHSWTYKPLVHDIFSMDLNRFTVEEPATLPGVAPSKKSFEVGDDDFFWEANGRAPFPQVAAESDRELSKYKQVFHAMLHTSCTSFEGSKLSFLPSCTSPSRTNTTLTLQSAFRYQGNPCRKDNMLVIRYISSCSCLLGRVRCDTSREGQQISTLRKVSIFAGNCRDQSANGKQHRPQYRCQQLDAADHPRAHGCCLSASAALGEETHHREAHKPAPQPSQGLHHLRDILITTV